MANWKKVIVSGSDAELKEVNTSSHITASGIISASGKLYGNLDENSDQTHVVVYNTATGELEYKLLNLINSTRAPELYLIDHDNDSDDTTNFKFSFDSSSNTGNPITAPFVLSASIGGAFDHAISTNDATFASEISINSTWGPTGIANSTYFNPDTSTNNTASQAEGHASGPGNGRFALNLGNATQQEDIKLHLQSVNEDSTATPSPTGTPYQAKGFDSPAPGDDGEIRVYVNTMELDTPTATIDVGPTVGAITTTDNANITCDISVSSSNVDGGEDDGLKCNRTGTVTIDTNAQNDGYNYAFLFYTGSRGSNQVRALTNFTEWFYDEDGRGESMVSALDGAADVTMVATSDNTHYISGIKYFSPNLTGNLVQRFTATNQYRNIYPVSTGLRFLNVTTNTIDNFSVTQSGENLTTSPDFTPLDATDSDQEVGLSSLAADTSAHLQQTNITASAKLGFDSETNYLHAPNDFFFQTSDGSAPFDDYVEEDIVDVKMTFRATHINKNNATDRTRTINNYLINALVSSSDTSGTAESFRGEKFRTRDRTYSFNDRGTDYLFDSSDDLDNSSTNGDFGLLQYGSYLVYPTKAGESSDGGDFSSTHGPTQDNDYGTLTGARTYFRYFRVPASPNGAGNAVFQIEFKGSGRIVPIGSSLFTGNSQYFNVSVQRLGDGSTTINNSNMTSAIIDALDSSIYNLSPLNSTTNYIPLNNSTTNAVNYNPTNYSGVSQQPNHLRSAIPLSDSAADTTLLEDEDIMVKIRVPQGWTGYIDAMAIRYGNYDAGSTPELNGITYK